MDLFLFEHLFVMKWLLFYHYDFIQALRIVLNCIESIANRYQRFIEPLISISVDFYVRLFVRIKTSAEQAKKTSLKRSHVLYCEQCFSYYIHPSIFLSYIYFLY